jgi:ABC-2 type transport system permease protein
MANHGRIGTIARREWRARVRERSFRVATGINLLLVLVAAFLPTIISYFTDDNGNSSTTIAIVDNAGVSAVNSLAPYVNTGVDNGDRITLITATFPAENAAVVDDGDADAVLTINRDGDGQLAFIYINDAGEFDTTAQRIYSGVAALTLADRLHQAGVSEEQFQQAVAEPNFTMNSGEAVTANSDDGTEGTEFFLAFIVIIAMFMAIQLYGTWIAQGVVEEKSSRIMEIMINAATPRDLLAGKIIGIGLAALTQLVPMLVIGGSAFALQPRIADALDIETASTFGSIDFGSLSVRAVAGFLVFFLLGFILYASLYAGVASTLSRQEDISQAVGPLMIFMMAGYISAFFTIPEPDSLFARILSIFPLTSPFNMAPRLIVTDVPAWELALSLALLTAAAVIGVIIAARIYRIGVLMYGQKPSLRTILLGRKNLQTTAR